MSGLDCGANPVPDRKIGKKGTRERESFIRRLYTTQFHLHEK